MSWGKHRKVHSNRETFSVPIEKEITKIDKNSNESVVTISYKIKFIDSARFMATLLSNFAYNLTEGNRKTKCGDCDCFLEYESVKENSIEYKCLSCNKSIRTKLTKNEKRD